MKLQRYPIKTPSSLHGIDRLHIYKILLQLLLFSRVTRTELDIHMVPPLVENQPLVPVGKALGTRDDQPRLRWRDKKPPLCIYSCTVEWRMRVSLWGWDASGISNKPGVRRIEHQIYFTVHDAAHSCAHSTMRPDMPTANGGYEGA